MFSAKHNIYITRHTSTIILKKWLYNIREILMNIRGRVYDKFRKTKKSCNGGYRTN